MDKKLQTTLTDSFLESFEPPFNGEVYEWAHQYVDLPPNYAIQGKFDINLSKYLVEPLKDLRNSDVNQVNLIAATQTGKTMASEIFLPYVIINDGGPVLKLHQTDDMAKTFVETRLIPLLERCEPVKAMLDNKRFSATITGVNLPHMSIKMGGAKENILHGLTIRYLMADEVWLWEKDHIVKAKARTTAYGNQKKVLITSQPGVEGDALYDEMTGKIFEWGWKCPACGEYQQYHWSKETESGSWAGMIWDKHLQSDSSSYDFEKTGDSARLQCYYCTGSLSDTETNRRYLNDTGKYLMVKDNGNPVCHTYMWPAAVNMKISFKQMVIQYLQSVQTHKRLGTTDGLRIFRQQVLGQFWRRSQSVEANKILATAFNPDEKWPDEIFRAIGVDYQRKNEVKYYVVCSFSHNEIRVLDHSFCHKWEDIAELQRKWNVPSAGVFVDSGYNADEVYRECCAHGQPVVINRKVMLYGWWALKGDGGHEFYNHKVGNDTVRRYFSPEIKASINNNQFARLIQWANLPIKNMIFHIRSGNSDIKLVLPTKDPLFDEHLNAESLQWVVDKTGVKSPRWIKHSDNNHWLDCLCECVVAASMRGIYGTDVIDRQNIINVVSGSQKT